MSEDLIKRLRAGPIWSDGSPIGSVVGEVNGGTMNEAADLIERLTSRPEEEAVERAKSFMRHDGLCAIIGGYGYCSCGMEAARDAVSPPPSGSGLT